MITKDEFEEEIFDSIKEIIYRYWREYHIKINSIDLDLDSTIVFMGDINVTEKNYNDDKDYEKTIDLMVGYIKDVVDMDKIDYMKPGALQLDGLREEKWVEIKLSRITVLELTKYLYNLRSFNQGIYIKRLAARKEGEYLNLILQPATVELR